MLRFSFLRWAPRKPTLVAPNRVRLFTRDPIGKDDEYPVAESTTAWHQLLDYVTNSYRLALVRGSPQSGKTSLGYRALYYANEKIAPFEDMDVVFCSKESLQGGEVNVDKVLCSRGIRIQTYEEFFDCCFRPDVITIVDDADTLFDQRSNPLHESYKNEKKFKCILLTSGSTRDTELKSIAPKELTPHQFWLHAAAEGDEVRKWIAAVMAKASGGTADGKAVDMLYEHAYPYCGNHIGLMSRLLDFYVEHKVLPDPSYFFSERIISGGDGDWTPSMYKRLVHPMMATGVLLLNLSAESEDIRRKIRQGLFAPFQRLEESLTKLQDTNTIEYTWSHPWQRDYALTCIAAPLVRVELKKLNRPIDMLLAALPHFQSEALLCEQRMSGAYQSFTEAQVRAQFSIGLAAVGVQFFLYEHPNCSGNVGAPPTVDFIVRTAKKKRIAIAIFVDETFVAHAKRANSASGAPSSRYPGVKSHLTVVFKTRDEENSMSSLVAATPYTALVQFSKVRGYNEFEVHYNDGDYACKFTLPRNGVPHYCAGFRADVAQEQVSPLRSGVWVKLGTDRAFNVTPAEDNIDSLKKAIKAKMQLTQRAPLLKITKDGALCTRMSEKLEANTAATPYVAEIPPTE